MMHQTELSQSRLYAHNSTQYICTGKKGNTMTQKRKCHHFDEIFITGCTESCQNDNFQCRQWRKFRQNDDISVSVELKHNQSKQMETLT